MRATALAGGTGAAKFLRGLASCTNPRDLTVIGNTADDADIWGLHVSPDLDTLTYALTGRLDLRRGWGLAEDSFNALAAMAALGGEAWFRLGDRDLATHIYRTRALQAGRSLSEVTAAIGRALGLGVSLLPMSDDPVRTRIQTPDGWLAFQHYFVRDGARPPVIGIEYAGAGTAAPAPGVLDAIRTADVVIVCEGIGLGSSLLEKTVIDGKPLRRKLRANEVAMAVKEIMQLDSGLIEERFNCEAGEGCTIECFGDSTMGMSGFMFIYTNNDTLSVGGGALLSEFNATLRSPNDLMEHFKNHAAVKPLLRGAETVEYLAHLIPEGGYRGIPDVYGPGYLVCGDAAMLSNPVHREGSNLAMVSGRMAGETVIHAKEIGDFSERRLREYRGKLDNSWVMADMKKYDGAVRLLEHNPQMLIKYPQVADRALDEFFRVDGQSKWQKQSNILGMVRREGMFRMGWDTFKALWTMK